jgi:flagellar biosynthesis component FlhA
MEQNTDNDKLAIVIGKKLIVKVKQMMKGIDDLRKEYNLENDFVIPPIRIIDGEKLPDNGYKIKIYGKMIKSKERRFMPISGLIKDLKEVIKENEDRIKD